MHDLDDEQPPLFYGEHPSLPYAGTSGWSGSDTSHERAVNADREGTTSKRQTAALSFVAARRWQGVTWKELGTHFGWHHGTASGVLSVLHKDARIARVKDRRDRCEIYVLPEYVGDRETAAHGRKRPSLDDEEREAFGRLRSGLPLILTLTAPDIAMDVGLLLRAVERLER